MARKRKSLFQKRMDRKKAKNEAKFGTNPITGEVFNRHTYKQYSKYGINPDGSLKSKFDASNRKNRQMRTEMRRDVRMGRNEVKITRSNNGNTLGETTFGPMFESVGNIFSSLFGGGESSQTDSEE